MGPIETTSTEEIVSLLYREGEEYYRLGQFQKALDAFLRCIRAPKDTSGREYDAKSYYHLGVIYGCLEQETLSKENLLKALKLCEELGIKKEMILCYMSLGYLHEKLKDYEQALAYMSKVLELLEDYVEDGTYIHRVCLAYHGIIYVKQGNYEQAGLLLDKIKAIAANSEKTTLGVSALDLALRVSYEKKEEEAFREYFEKLLCLTLTKEGFLESTEFYFDISTFLQEKKLAGELRRLLDYMKVYANQLPLAYMKYHIYTFEVGYMRDYGTEEQYEEAIQKLLEVLAEYESEQQRSKLYSFDYIEYFHEERNLSAKMEQKSKLDPMTGLLNKYTIEFLVDEYFKKMDRDTVAALLLIDMDHFKQINDTLGHLAGDVILADTATIIRRFFKEDSLCGRVGGDEFMVFVKDVKDMSTLLLQAEILRQEIAKTTQERNITIAIQASVGVAVSTAGFYDYASIFAAADEALYRAKKGGRNKISVIE